MADYPSALPVCVGTRVKPADDLRVDRATNGAARARALYTATKRVFVLEHKALDASERDTLDSFYETNKTASVTLTFDGTAYACLFAGPPDYDYIGGNYANATVELVEA